jgi:large subunit ribosomal protein L5
MTKNDSTPRLRRHYDEQVRKRLQEIFGFDNPMEIPRLEKIVMNTGLCWIRRSTSWRLYQASVRS